MEDTASRTQSGQPVAYSRPKTRQRVHKAAPTLDVPDIGEDASERKRVLNVLAQRRYRERKRQSRLAGQKQGHGSNQQACEAPSDAPVSLAHDFVDPIEPAVADRLPLTAEAGSVAVADFGMDAWPLDLSDDTSISDFIFGTTNPPTIPNQGLAGTALGMTSRSPSTIDPTSLVSSSASSSSASSDFPDGYLLPMSDLKVLKGLLRIATRLGSDSVMWNPEANSPFNQGMGTPAELLPETWRPTAAQAMTPHHPIMDFLPWPEVRDRIISVFSLPDAARPPAARGPLGLVNFAYDLEDSSEGARIWGADPYDASSWEVGQVLFERWWFVFDRGVVEQSNRWRRMRGATALQLRPGGSVRPLADDVTGVF